MLLAIATHGQADLEEVVVNLLGTLFLDPAHSMWEVVDGLVEEARATTPVVVVDVHAEATSEKAALGFYLDGRVSAVWGTHTHVQTSDAQVLPKGTGFITDLGMTGPAVSVLGIDPQQSIGKFLGEPPRRYESAPGPGKMECALMEIDTETGKCLKMEALRIL